MALAPVTQSINSFLVFILSFGFGVFISSFLTFPPLVSVLIICVGLCLLTADKIWYGKVSQEVFIISLILASLAFGSLRYAIKDFHTLETPAETGVVVSEPEDRENTRRFTFLSSNNQKVLVSVPLYTDIQYGDRVRVIGKLERPGVIEGEEGERDFDYERYLSKDDIYYTLSFAEVEVLERGVGNPVKSTLLKIKQGFVSQIREILPEPQSSLLAGLLVAGRDAMPQGILEEFRRSGLIHVVVLSGFNITLIAEFLRRIMQTFLLSRQWTRWPHLPATFSVLGVFAFVIMTGGEATVVRAALMALTVVFAGFIGRGYSASRALLFAGFIMVLFNPKILVFDPSFQLSFLATLGLIHLRPWTETKLWFLTQRLGFREMASQTISTQITVLPLLIYLMGDVSLVSLPANILALLVVPWAMLMGFVAIMVSFVNTALSWPLAFMTHLLLSWILWVAHFFGSLSFATLKIF